MRIRTRLNIQSEEWILAIMFAAGFLLTPLPIGRKFLLLQQPGMAIGILLLSILNLRKRQLSLSLDWVSIALGAFVGLHFLSTLWATHISKVWMVSFAWLMLFLFYLNIRVLDISSFSKIFWKRLVLAVLSINLILFAWFLFDIGWGENGFQYQAQQMREIIHYFPNNDNSTAVIFLVLLLLLFHLKGSKNSWVTYTVSGIALLFLLLLGSKIPVLILVLISVIYLFQQTEKVQRKRVVIGGLAFLGTVAGFVFLFSDNPQFFFENLDPTRPFRMATGDDRIVIWKASLLLWKENPFLGIGSGNWMFEYLKYGIGDYHLFKNYFHSHNLTLEVLSELGILGGLFITFLLLIPFRSYFQPMAKPRRGILYAILFTFLACSSYYGIAYCINGRFAALQYLWVGTLAVWSAFKHTSVRKVSFRWPILILAIICLCWQGFYVHKILTFKAYRIAHTQQNFPLAEEVYQNLYSPYVFEFILNEHIPGIHGGNLLQAKQYKKAAALLATSTQKSPYEYKNWRKLGDSYIALSKNEKAIVAYQRSLSLNPKGIDCAYQLAQASFQAKDWDSFDTGVAVYYDFLLPLIETKYNPETWFPPSPGTKSYGIVMCGLQDKFILLIDKKESLFQSEISKE